MEKTGPECWISCSLEERGDKASQGLELDRVESNATLVNGYVGGELPFPQV